MRPSEGYYPEPEGKITVQGDKIYLDNELYAELRYTGSYYTELPNSRFNKDDPDYGGFAMYYYPYDKEEWIFPKEGWAYYVVEERKKYSTVAEMDKLDRTAKERGLTYRLTGLDYLDSDKVYLMVGDSKFQAVEKSASPKACDIQITEDGKYVCYKIRGNNKLRSYRVKYENCFKDNR